LESLLRILETCNPISVGKFSPTSITVTFAFDSKAARIEPYADIPHTQNNINLTTKLGLNWHGNSGRGEKSYLDLLCSRHEGRLCYILPAIKAFADLGININLSNQNTSYHSTSSSVSPLSAVSSPESANANNHYSNSSSNSNSSNTNNNYNIDNNKLMLFNKQQQQQQQQQNYFVDSSSNRSDFQANNQFTNELQQQQQQQLDFTSKMLSQNESLLLNDSAVSVAAASSLLTFQPNLLNHYSEYGHDLVTSAVSNVSSLSSSQNDPTNNSDYSEQEFKYSKLLLPQLNSASSTQQQQHEESHLKMQHCSCQRPGGGCTDISICHQSPLPSVKLADAPIF
jgi:hypothetical protein